jgi:hypothetical protein
MSGLVQLLVETRRIFYKAKYSMNGVLEGMRPYGAAPSSLLCLALDDARTLGNLAKVPRGQLLTKVDDC